MHGKVKTFHKAPWAIGSSDGMIYEPLIFLLQGSGSSGSGGGSGSGYGAELSSDIGAAISSPAPVSPACATLDFEPPRDDSPMGSTDMHPGSNSNSSLSDYNKVRALYNNLNIHMNYKLFFFL